MNAVYVKAVLYAYPYLKMLAEATRSGAEVKARLSFRTENTLDTAEKIAEEILLARRLDELSAAVERMTEKLTPEETFLLEYKYFRSGGNLRGELACSEREYFRRQADLVKKAGFLLSACGMTQERLINDFGGCPFFRRLVRAIAKGRERAVAGKRRERGVSFQKSEFSCGTEGFLPRMTNTAIATAAQQATHITAICTAESPVLFPVSSEGEGR